MKHPKVSPYLVHSVRTPLNFLVVTTPLQFLKPGGAQNKIEWVSKTNVFKTFFSLLHILTPRCKTSIVSQKITYIRMYRYASHAQRYINHA